MYGTGCSPGGGGKLGLGFGQLFLTIPARAAPPTAMPTTIGQITHIRYPILLQLETGRLSYVHVALLPFQAKLAIRQS